MKIKFECKECDYETTQRGHFVKHHEYVHRLSLLISVKIKFECKECFSTLETSYKSFLFDGFCGCAGSFFIVYSIRFIFCIGNIKSHMVSLNVNNVGSSFYIYYITGFLRFCFRNWNNFFMINILCCSIVYNILLSIKGPILPTLTLETRRCYWMGLKSLPWWRLRTRWWFGG